MKRARTWHRGVAALATAVAVAALAACGPEGDDAPPPAAPERTVDAQADRKARKALAKERAEARKAEMRAHLQRAFAEDEPTDPDLQYYRGFAYMYGKAPVKRDQREALVWMRRAAEQGHARAQVALGLAHQRAKGGLPVDHVKAVEWFRRAAEHRDTRALLELGIAYRDGRGVEKDQVEALKWFVLSSRAGGLAANPMRISLTKTLPKPDVHLALALAKRWEGVRGYTSGSDG